MRRRSARSSSPGGIAARVGSHAPVVQNDGGDGCSGPDRGLDVQTRHAKSAVAHEVQAEFVGVGQLGSDHQRDTVAQVSGLAPADVAVGYGGPVEGHDGVPGSAGVVGDDAVLMVQGTLQLPDHSIGVYRHLVRVQEGCPLGQPAVSAFAPEWHFGSRIVPRF